MRAFQAVAFTDSLTGEIRSIDNASDFARIERAAGLTSPSHTPMRTVLPALRRNACFSFCAERCILVAVFRKRGGVRMVERGKLIVFEGLDGSGKSTQLKKLEQRLRAMGRQV